MHIGQWGSFIFIGDRVAEKRPLGKSPSSIFKERAGAPLAPYENSFV
jgi:hypothetical protein